MKLVKTASGKKIIRMSKKEWQSIGKKAGWMKVAQSRGGRLDSPAKAIDIIKDEFGNGNFINIFQAQNDFSKSVEPLSIKITNLYKGYRTPASYPVVQQGRDTNTIAFNPDGSGNEWFELYGFLNSTFDWEGSKQEGRGIGYDAAPQSTYSYEELEVIEERK